MFTEDNWVWGSESGTMIPYSSSVENSTVSKQDRQQGGKRNDLFVWFWISLMFTERKGVWNSVRPDWGTYLKPVSEGMPLYTHTGGGGGGGGGVLRLLRTVDSSLAAYISLTGQKSTSALLRASTPHRPTAANLPLQSVNRRQARRRRRPRLMLLLTLTAFIAASPCPFRAEPQEDRRRAQRFSEQPESPNYTQSFLCSYNADILCYIPQPDTPGMEEKERNSKMNTAEVALVSFRCLLSRGKETNWAEV